MSADAEPTTETTGSAGGASRGSRASLPGAPQSTRDEPPPEVLRRGRRWATIVFLALVATFTVLESGQIAQQALFPVPVPAGPECGQNLTELVSALDRARSEGEHDLDPDVALSRFRAALAPEWTRLEGVRATCATAVERRSLDALERLRYAEEHAVRREAASLAALRRQVASDVASRAGSAPDRNARTQGPVPGP